MENFYKRLRNLKLPKKNEIKIVISSFSKKELIVFFGFVALLTISAIGIAETINKTFMVEVPMHGGSMTEGIVGSPRFINPILSFSDTDNDLTSLVYSGLMRKDNDGNLIPDLAEKYKMSDDGLSYIFTLKNNLYFHDGKPLTADDVLFTINEVKNPATKSPKKANWDGISVDKIDAKTIKFTLKQPYAAFLENSTLGILPQHLWSSTSSNSPIEINDLNTNPIGSGPYEVKSIDKQSSGTINSYELSSFNKFSLGKPYIDKITLRFYANEKELVSAMENGEVDQVSSITPENAEILKERNFTIQSSVLPRVFGLFFNQNQNQIFTDKNVVKAINEAINKDKIVNDVLSGYGVVIDDPIPPNMIQYQKLSNDDNISHEDKLILAQNILAKDGWKKGTDGVLEKTTVIKKKKTTARLEFSISTSNIPELAKAANQIQQDLEDIGIQVDVKTFDVGNLNQYVIRPRKYDALLFGQIITHESDLFAFWHSSQRKDPGLNVAMYTNAKVDKILESAFSITDEQTRVKKYAQFEDEIAKDMPAVFLYSPKFIYVVSKNIKGFSLDHINSPSDRFLNSYSWYIDTDNVWKIFSK
ncbi:MAG: ABC transporter substrate-binding protein [bacterium]